MLSKRHPETDEILQLLRDREAEIKRRFHVKRIGLFGSYARSEQGEGSDIDILVEFEEPTFDNFMELSFFLEKLFEVKVDIVTPAALSPYIRPQVIEEVVWCE